MTSSSVDRSSIWLPLLLRFTQVAPTWMVWKNVGSALSGYGDIDSSAAASEWPILIDEFQAWAKFHRLGPVIICQHVPDFVILVALRDAEPFFEVDIITRKIYRGATMFMWKDLVPLQHIDELGFRRLRWGAEGVLTLLLNGTRKNGSCDGDALRSKNVSELLAQDPAGAERMARLFGPSEKATLQLIDALSNGGWNRRAALTLEGWFVLRALTEPKTVLEKVRVKFAGGACPVMQAMFAGRRVPANRTAWLDQVRRIHAVHDLLPQ